MEKSVTLAGFNLTKISGEKNPNFEGKIEMNSSINIKNIERFKPELAKQDSLLVEFSLEINYKELGKIELHGDLILILDSKTMKEILNSWKDKNIPDEINLFLLNLIMQKSSVKALQLEEELGLPTHIKIPIIKRPEKSN